MQKYFRVTFKAELIKFVLAFKADCQIDVFWKKGQKIAQSAKVPLTNTVANINESLTICCNMVFDVQKRSFKQKSTKFEIILYTQKGNKKVGQIRFDVSSYLNQRLKMPKQYQLPLDKCPDKNSRLVIKLSASIGEQISEDAISNSSSNTVNIENLVKENSQMSIISSSFIQQGKSNVIPKSSNSISIPTKDVVSAKKQSRTDVKISTITSIEDTVSRNPPTQSDPNTLIQKSRNFQLENKRIRQQLKAKSAILKENEQLKRKIKNQQYDSVCELKEKIENGRKQMQKLHSTIKKQILLEKEVKSIEDQIFRCKFQIMSAFNYANERGGGTLMFEMQEACGLREV